MFIWNTNSRVIRVVIWRIRAIDEVLIGSNPYERKMIFIFYAVDTFQRLSYKIKIMVTM